jgi:hypothetical protein
MDTSKKVLSSMAVALLAVSLVGLTPVWADAGSLSFGSGGLKSQGVPGSINGEGYLLATIVVTNTSKVGARMFVSSLPSASDNKGHAWIADIMNGYVTGIHVCKGQSACLGGDRKSTEELATVLDPDQSLTVSLTMHPSIAGKRECGDLYNVGFLAMVQPVREDTTASGSVFVGGAWRSTSLGVVNIPLRCEN